MQTSEQLTFKVQQIILNYSQLTETLYQDLEKIQSLPTKNQIDLVQELEIVSAALDQFGEILFNKWVDLS